MGGQQRYTMQNTKMITVGLLLALYFNGCLSQDNEFLNPFDVPALKVLFRCDGRLCPVGQDCLSVDGTPRCADPCKHYSVLNDSWRANDHLEDPSDPHCDDDVDWMGWYRMYIGDVSVRMPERCQPLQSCGTLAPSFLAQPHPKVGDGVQQHTICATWENGCCKFNLNPFHIKTCPGNFVVYKLVNPHDCRVGYCADVKTKVCVSCAEDQDCVSDDKITYRCEKRAATPVPEAADNGSPINPFDVPALKVLFRCDGRVCPPDQDCLSIDGAPHCADPCLHYSVLNDTWRANDHMEDVSDPHCDDEVDWQGWYRMFLGDVSYRMPERCQPLQSCGTLAPLFLVQPHPKVGDGVQKHTVCGTWENGCCKFHLNPIHVKACPGNYVVYKLVNPNDCRVGYCADVKTKVCATCGDGLDCVSDDKINYRCEQGEILDTSVFMTPEHKHEEIVVVEKLDSFRVPNTHFDGKESQDPHQAYSFSITIPKIVCGPEFMDIGLKLEEADKAGLDVNTARMIDPRCHKGVTVNGRMWFRIPRTDGTCGNTVKSNRTHAIFNNHMFMEPFESQKTKVLPLDLPISCYYPLGTETSLDVAVATPLAISAPAPAHKVSRSVAPSVAPVITSGVGPEPRLVMSMYKSSSFEEILPAGPQRLPLGLVMYVGVTVEDVKEKEIVVVLEDCFQTHTSDFNDPIQDPIITNKCSADFILVAVLETAKSHQARFSTLLVPFPGKDHDMYLHCSASLCDTRTTNCKPTCAGRRFGRSAPSPAHQKLTIGPITFEKN